MSLEPSMPSFNYWPELLKDRCLINLLKPCNLREEEVTGFCVSLTSLGRPTPHKSTRRRKQQPVATHWGSGRFPN